MSALARSASKACIIALPLTTGSSTTGRLTYYHFHVPPKDYDKPNWFHKATIKAANAWTALGKAPEGNWKHTIFKYGERVMDMVDFEELSLQSLDPPKELKDPKSQGNGDAEKERKDKNIVPLFHPSSLASSTSPVSELQDQVKHRIPLHRKGLITWLVVIPLTVPIGILPIIPNLPGYYAIWRAWSNYRALKASKYVDTLLGRNLVVPCLDTDIDKIYHKFGTPLQPPKIVNCEKGESQQSSTVEGSTPQNHDRMVIQREAISHLIEHFDLPPSAATNLFRAYDQSVSRLVKGARRT